MSEFKFTCPVCGQHMMCDSSQAKTVMECPTCFQKITAPQASAPDAKFILTGTKVSQRPLASLGGQDSKSGSLPKKKCLQTDPGAVHDGSDRRRYLYVSRKVGPAAT